jgi:hypothetical protein
VSGSDAQPQLLQSGQRDRAAFFVHDRKALSMNSVCVTGVRTSHKSL